LQPEEGWNLGRVIGVKVAQGEKIQILKSCPGLVETRECPAPGVDHDAADTVDPDEVPGRSSSDAIRSA
jgi:hypothetical protein